MDNRNRIGLIGSYHEIGSLSVTDEALKNKILNDQIKQIQLLAQVQVGGRVGIEYTHTRMQTERPTINRLLRVLTLEDMMSKKCGLSRPIN